VPVPEYVLLSEALFRAAAEPVKGRGRRIEEELEDLGPTAMYFVDLSEVGAELPPKAAVTRFAQTRENLGVITVLEYLDDWRAMARQGVAEARGLLRAVLVDRLVFTPVTRPPELPPRKGPSRRPLFVYEFRGEAVLSKLSQS
jgi:hypothetical protein